MYVYICIIYICKTYICVYMHTLNYLSYLILIDFLGLNINILNFYIFLS